MGLIDSKRSRRLYDVVLATRTNCRFEALRGLLLALGFSERQPSRGGSHYTYRKRLADGRVVQLTVPRRRRLKQCYVDAVIELMEEAS